MTAQAIEQGQRQEHGADGRTGETPARSTGGDRTGLFMLVLGLAAKDLYGPLLIRGLFGGLLVLPVAGLTFQEFAPETFGHAYRTKNIMRQLCNTFAGAMMAAPLRHRQDAHWSDLVGFLSPANPVFGARAHVLAGLLVVRALGGRSCSWRVWTRSGYWRAFRWSAWPSCSGSADSGRES